MKFRGNLPNPAMYPDWKAWAKKLIAMFGAGDEEQVMDVYSKTSLPSASGDPYFIVVNDEVGGMVPAFNDGTYWRRVTDRAVVS